MHFFCWQDQGAVANLSKPWGRTIDNMKSLQLENVFTAILKGDFELVEDLLDALLLNATKENYTPSLSIGMIRYFYIQVLIKNREEREVLLDELEHLSLEFLNLESVDVGVTEKLGLPKFEAFLELSKEVNELEFDSWLYKFSQSSGAQTALFIEDWKTK